MTAMTSTALRDKVEQMLAEATLEAEQWSLARDEKPFPEFPESTRKDQAWQSGLSEGKELGRISALKEILKNL